MIYNKQYSNNIRIYEAYWKSNGRLLIFKYWRIKAKLYACLLIISEASEVIVFIQ